MKEKTYCPVCGGENFNYSGVLWPQLVTAWQISQYEVDYINRQQGFCCVACGNNLRSMALAAAILHTYNFSGTLRQFVVSGYKKKLKVLEINEAGRLSPILQKLPDHRLVRFPEYDMANLAFESDTFDLIIHSDTLEHVPNPERALSECRRVLCGNGKCIFTVPIIVNRTTRSRAGLALSYHGRPGVPAEDQVVFTEFGADIWQTVLKAGFCTCEIFTLEYPSALAIIARK